MIENTKKLLGKFISSSRDIIPMDVLEEVTHYFEHCEFEMAFEGLLIELTNVGRYPKDFKYSEWLELAALYKLDKGFVFDEEIWRKFAAWGEAYVVSD